MPRLRRLVAVIAAGLVLMSCSTLSSTSKPPYSVTLGEGIGLQIATWGPDQATVARTAGALLSRPAVRKFVGDASVRVLRFGIADEVDGPDKVARPPTRYEALLYDDTNERTLIARGEFARPDEVEIEPWGFQPPPTAAEFATAAEILREDAEVGPLLKSGSLVAYRAMPGVAEDELDDGGRRRIITVGLRPSDRAPAERARHEIVGVSLAARAVLRDGLGGIRVFGDTNVCEPPPDAGQATVEDASGQANITVTQSGKTIWTFVVVRPAASSGTRGSGVELRHVYYKGVKVLARAHVPILNIHYDKDACGPYRDWQNEEGRIQATGSDAAPGIRVCPSPAQTIAETGSDTGNFNGVAIYVEGQDVVLVSEMEAGWYRYISKWRLNTNGTIKPQFGFAAVTNGCTCKLHFHNCYWRLDFDIDGAGGDRIDEFNDPAIVGGSNWHAKSYEMKRPRSPGHQRKWKVSDSGRSYTLTPGTGDGTADTFARGDLWFLRYHSGQLDDGHNSVGSDTEADISKFDNDEYLVGRDVVVWYSAHFTHDAGHSHGATFLGPTLVPAGW